jgi:hypothetical protein
LNSDDSLHNPSFNIAGCSSHFSNFDVIESTLIAPFVHSQSSDNIRSTENVLNKKMLEYQDLISDKTEEPDKTKSDTFGISLTEKGRSYNPRSSCAWIKRRHLERKNN